MSKDFGSRDEILHQFARYLQLSPFVISRFNIDGEPDGRCSFSVRGGKAHVSFGLGNELLYFYPKGAEPHIYSSIPISSTFPYESHYDLSYPEIWLVEYPHEVWILHNDSITSFCLLPSDTFNKALSEEISLEQSYPELKLTIENELEIRKVEVIWALPQCLKLACQLDTPRRITIKPLTSETSILNAHLHQLENAKAIEKVKEIWRCNYVRS
jgi:hypothetical protein